MRKENVLVGVLVALALGGIILFTGNKRAEKTQVQAESQAGRMVADAVADQVTGNAVTAAGTVTEAVTNSGDTGIDWKDFTPGMARAKKEDKSIFLYFHAQWCTYCTKLKKTTFLDKKVQAYLDEHFISIAVDTDKHQGLAREWKVKGLPTMWFLKADGSEISSLPGYVGGNQLLQILRYIHTKSYDQMSFHDFVTKG